MDTSLAIYMLLDIYHGGTVSRTLAWNHPSFVRTRHLMYVEGLIKQNRDTGLYTITDKGFAWIDALEAVKLPVKQTVTVDKWVVAA